MNEDNNIRQQFQSKLNNFEARVPEDGWVRLEESLIAASKLKRLRSRWYIGSAAAVRALLIGSLLFFPTSIEDPSPIITQQKTIPQTEEHKKSEKQKAKHKVPAQYAHKNKKKAVSGIRQNTEKENDLIFASGESPAKLNPVEKSSSEIERTSEKDQSSPQKQEKEISQAEKDRLIEEFAQAGKKDMLLAALETGAKTKNRNTGIGITGGGGLLSSERTVNAPMTLRSASANPKDKEHYSSPPKQLDLTSNPADNIAEMEHAQPVSLGITVSKVVFDNLSVETGLVYTYLYSKTKNTNINSDTKETLHIHYLGIPVNVNYYFLSIHKLDIYASLGGMIEKDIHGEFRRNRNSEVKELNSSSSKQETISVKQDNPQLSINAGFGLSYPIYKNLNLYGKIGGAYYFETNNPYKTIYSEQKIMLDLNLGLRVEF